MSSHLVIVIVFLLGLSAGVILQRALRRERPSASLPTSMGAVEVALSEHLPVSVLVFSDSGVIRFANRQAEALLFEGRCLQGENFLTLLEVSSPEIRAALLQREDSLIQIEFEGEFQQYQLLRRDFLEGEEPQVLLVVNPLTRELSRRELAALKKVIRVISHEFNNSFATMSSLVESAKLIEERRGVNEQMRVALSGIEARTNHLKEFVSHYARLSRLPEPNRRQVTLSPWFARLLESYPKVQRTEVEAETGWFDEMQMELALVNLLKNAQESGSASGEIELLARVSGTELHLGVLDRGEGFSAEALQSGLLPFYTTKEHGSGMGLALCREVAERHGGSLRVKRRAEGGSAVYLVLPQFEGEKGKGAGSRQTARSALTLTQI